jgi:hypothetical protein
METVLEYEGEALIVPYLLSIGVSTTLSSLVFLPNPVGKFFFQSMKSTRALSHKIILVSVIHV